MARGAATEDVAALVATAPSVERGRVVRGDLPEVGCVAVRRYRRGGLVRHVLGNLYWGTGRAQREFELYCELERLGLPSLEPVAAFGQRAMGPWWRLTLLTRWLDQATDLRELYAQGLAVKDPGARAGVLRACARVVRTAHDYGLVHPDLNLGNLLVEESGGQHFARILDLDRASLKAGGVSHRERIRMLLRLYRSALKVLRKAPGELTRTDTLRFALSYCNGNRAQLRELALALKRYSPYLRLRRVLWSGLSPRSGGRSREMASTR